MRMKRTCALRTLRETIINAHNMHATRLECQALLRFLSRGTLGILCKYVNLSVKVNTSYALAVFIRSLK